MITRTLSAPSEDDASVVLGDHLYLVIAGGKPGRGARWSLAGIDSIVIGRGAQRSTRRDGKALRIDCPDPWMSTAHLRFERESAHWVAVDAGSRNGILVSGAKVERMAVISGEVIEAGRSFFMLGLGEPVGTFELAAEARPLATLLPELAVRFGELREIARTGVPVLIGGATGTGKERVAAALHADSGRRGAFVPVNCGALPPALVESELFGHKKGAFTGALADAPGLVVASDGGTLFLDEIGDLPAHAQAALLRVLEEHEVRAVGATTGVAIDLRVVAATHRDLAERVESGEFREDLYARLAGFELELPPLAERRVDLGAMLAEISPDVQLSAAAVRALLAYAWPRNIRELVHAIERAAALAGPGEIALAHLPEAIAAAKLAPEALQVDPLRDQLVALLAKHRGNISHVAAEMGRLRQQVQRWLKRYAIDADRYR